MSAEVGVIPGNDKVKNLYDSWFRDSDWNTLIPIPQESKWELEPIHEIIMEKWELKFEKANLTTEVQLEVQMPAVDIYLSPFHCIDITKHCSSPWRDCWFGSKWIFPCRYSSLELFVGFVYIIWTHCIVHDLLQMTWSLQLSPWSSISEYLKLQNTAFG